VRERFHHGLLAWALVTAGAIIDRLEVPRIHISVVVLEGAGEDVLRVAAGHVPGTAMPGKRGNIGIAAHRDTLFRPLRFIRIGDEITMTTPSGSYRFSVQSTEIVGPNKVRVLDPTADSELTLVTCYPFFYTGPAPKRFIVHARACWLSRGA